MVGPASNDVLLVVLRLSFLIELYFNSVCERSDSLHESNHSRRHLWGVLRDRMIEEMKLRNLSLATQQSYVYAVSRLARYHNKAPDQLSKEDIRAFLVHLTVERKLSPNSFEYRYAEGKTERLPQLARELIDEKVDVIVVGGTRVAVMAKKATSTIPIVVAGAGDLVEAGLIKSFMYPGGM